MIDTQYLIPSSPCPRNGLTILELVIATIAITVMLVLIIPATMRRSGCSRLLKDATQVEQIQQAMLIYAREFDGRCPTPGLINRLHDPATGLNTPNVGSENFSLNHTAPLYSAMIAQNFVSPELIISPVEPNAFVTVKDNYNYMAYDPSADSYWDTTLTAHVDRAALVSNTSYAHMALCGERKKKYWNDCMLSNIPILGTRGPEAGVTIGERYVRSPTLKFLGEGEYWVGNIVFADNHVETIDTLEPESLQQPNAPRPYNLFRMDGGALSISIASTADDVERIWDPLQ